jgi:hypothetical protein
MPVIERRLYLTALVLLAGCGEQSVADRLARGSASVCKAEDVRDALRLALIPDTGVVKARIQPNSTVSRDTIDVIASDLVYDLGDTRLAASDETARTADCRGVLTVSSPQYGAQGSPVPIQYRIAANTSPTGFTITPDAAARDAAQAAFLVAVSSLDAALTRDDQDADRANALLDGSAPPSDPLNAQANSAISFDAQPAR